MVPITYALVLSFAYQPWRKTGKYCTHPISTTITDESHKCKLFTLFAGITGIIANICINMLISFMCRWTMSWTHYCHYTWWLHSLLLLFWTILYRVVGKNAGCMFGLNPTLQGGNLLSPRTMSCPSELVGFLDGWNGLDYERQAFLVGGVGQWSLSPLSSSCRVHYQGMVILLCDSKTVSLGLVW